MTTSTEPTSQPVAALKKTYLKDYQPPTYVFDSIDLTFDIFDDYTRVTAVSKLSRNPKAAQSSELRLDGRGLKLEQVLVNGTKVEPLVDAEGLTLINLPESFTLEVVTQIFPHDNKAFEGLYLSKGILCTQCEAQGFRRITYYLDRPDNMSLFSTTIRADKTKFPHLLSNGNLIHQKEIGSNRKEVLWRDPFKKPCYLFALVAGDMDFLEDSFTTRSGRKVALQIFAGRGRTERCHHAMESLKRCMKWDEERFGREYDLDLFMIAAVDDFNYGAMENKGLNIFSAKYVLSNPQTATDMNNYNIEAVVGHEYFHNWSGDRVTCRDWFQLSLKEGLTVYRDQEFSADVFSRSYQRIQDVTRLRENQFSEDAGPNSHPVRPESFVTIDNFYTATIYNKGAEVIRMMATLLGWPAFRKGCDTYFDTNDGKAVTTDDFVEAIETSNSVDFSQFKRWYSQAGTPHVTVRGNYDASHKTYTLDFEQNCPPTPGQKTKQPFVIPVKLGLLDRKTGQELKFEVKDKNIKLARTNDVIALTDTKQSFVLTGVNAEPVPSLFRDFSAPVNFDFPYSDSDRMLLMKYDTNVFNRWDATQKICIKEILQAIDDLGAGKKASYSEGLIEAFRLHLERSSEDRLVSAKLLSLPLIGFIKQFAKPVNPDLLMKAVADLETVLGTTHKDLFLKVYNANKLSGPYRYQPDDAGKRSLRNLCLHYLCATGEASAYKLASVQYFNSDNMTEQEGAMLALRDHDCAERTAVNDAFYQTWKNDPLILNVWHQAVSASRVASTLSEIDRIFSIPDFDRYNPNNLYSVVGAFAYANETQFHRPDGKGYDWVAKHIVEIDKKNGMVAARLASAFDVWNDYIPENRDRMRKTIDEILKTPGLSKNTFEILSNAIAP